MITSNLKGYMQLAKLSQKDVAGMLDCSTQQVSNWATGASSPTLEKALKLAKIVGQPVDVIWKISEE